MTLPQDALSVLKATSRTFYIPISRLPAGLQEVIASGYLCMRAIDEIEDHPTLDNLSKAKLLRRISLIFQAQTSMQDFAFDDFTAAFSPYQDRLPEVTLRLAEWACLAPEAIAPRIWEATAAMADRMAEWAANGWKIQTEADLDRYTYGVAGAVGLLICDLWAWFDKFQMNRIHAIHFGRGLQLVNILRNRAEDLARGIDLFPEGWSQERMQEYARQNLALAEAYARTLPPGPFVYLIKIPLTLAFATLDALARGEPKLSRSTVLQLVRQLGYESGQMEQAV